MVVIEPSVCHGIVLFGAGAGGDPGRYSTLLDAFASAGLLVLAPQAEQFDPRSVTAQQLQDRVDGLRAALVRHDDGSLPVIAAGHSVGGWAALCLGGAQPWSRDGRPIPVTPEPRVTRLVLFAPTVGWFRAPRALDGVTVPIVVHTGKADIVTPAVTAEVLRVAPAAVTITVHDNVGHFDFMTELPPRTSPTPGLDHPAFLHGLAAQVADELT